MAHLNPRHFFWPSVPKVSHESDASTISTANIDPAFMQRPSEKSLPADSRSLSIVHYSPLRPEQGRHNV